MDWYSKYNGKNMGGILIPKVLTKSIRNKTYTNNQQNKKSNKVKPYVSLTELGIPLDLNFFRQSILHTSNSKFNTIAETTLDDVRKEFFGSENKWNEKTITKEALKYNTKNEFQKANRSAYNATFRLGITEKVFSHMTEVFHKWTITEIKEVANKFKTKSEFYKDEIGRRAYGQARKLDILDDVCKHMDSYYTEWTPHLVKKIAKQYNTRTEFQKGSKSAYGAARKFGLDMFCKHMKRPDVWNKSIKK
jgi:hypothetical protein